MHYLSTSSKKRDAVEKSGGPFPVQRVQVDTVTSFMHTITVVLHAKTGKVCGRMVCFLSWRYMIPNFRLIPDILTTIVRSFP
jgi:hypothetical protein